MKVAVAGKGGVGKTFVSGTLARLFSRDGVRVTAIDADPAMNLGRALGIPSESMRNLIPIAERKDLIKERTGVEPGETWGAVFKLTPYVGDLAEKYGIEGPDGVRLLVMGTVRTAGGGCMCPANALLTALLR
ncbi:AAA family ATPase, partial [Candidatus Bathyarchaeota archaeon]|nr:AAA family ATPase [Candidatus Bathyarchaeota archaeon]